MGFFVKFVLYCVVLPSVSTVFGLEDCKFPALFNFGDSNSDTGQLNAAFPPSIYKPYGDTFFHEPAGRYSDGRNIIDFIAASLDLPLLNVYLDSLGTNFKTGANFASSAATITKPQSIIPAGDFSPFFLGIQRLQFVRMKSKSDAKKFPGQLPDTDSFKPALYTFDIGQNDLTQALKGNLSVEQVRAKILDSVTIFVNEFKEIYTESGGASFWIHNTGPIGCLPSTLSTFPSEEKDEVGCAKYHNEVAQFFNTKLKEAVVQLRKDFPSAAITLVDVYSVKYSLFQEPEKYGFEKPFVACCGHGGEYNFSMSAICGKKVEGSEVLVGSCEDPSKRITWDGIHYTEAANKAVFDKISTGEFSDPPVSLKQACHQSAA